MESTYSQPSARGFSITKRLRTNCSIPSRAFFRTRTYLLLASTRSQNSTFITLGFVGFAIAALRKSAAALSGTPPGFAPL